MTPEQQLAARLKALSNRSRLSWVARAFWVVVLLAGFASCDVRCSCEPHYRGEPR